MAKTTLPTDFQDDVLNASMNGKRRYNEVTNDDGTFSLEDVTAYDTVGSDFGASTVNEMNRNINESFDAGKIISDMDTLEATSVSGYAPDALLLKEVNNSLQNNGAYRIIDIIDVKKSATIDASSTASVTLSWTAVDGADLYIPLLRGSGWGGALNAPITTTSTSITVTAVNASASSHSCAVQFTILAVKIATT